MSEAMTDRPTEVRRLAEWVRDFAAQPLDGAALERLRIILLDSLACAIAARHDDTVAQALALVDALGSTGTCSLIGHARKTTLPLAAFANGVLIRSLDLNDTYVGPRQIGHPSDNVGTALAACEHADRSGLDLLRAIRLGYEIYGRVQDLFDPETTDWDHTSASGLVSAAVVGWALDLPADHLAHALALAATHSATLREVRGSSISAAKSIANAVVTQSAVMLALLAREGATGPRFALEGKRGFAKVVLREPFDGFFAFDGTPNRYLAASMKFFPCFALAQGPIAAAVELRRTLPAPIMEAEQIVVALADSQPARLRLGDPAGRMPDSHEAADHSIHYLAAMALLEGSVTVAQFERERWRDADVKSLMSRIEARIEHFPPGPPKAFPCRVTARFTGGREIAVERPISPGHPALAVSWEEAQDKFRSCAFGAMDERVQARLLEGVRDIERAASIRPLMQMLAG
jgi:2-methylcitrate dehydratase